MRIAVLFATIILVSFNKNCNEMNTDFCEAFLANDKDGIKKSMKPFLDSINVSIPEKDNFEEVTVKAKATTVKVATKAKKLKQK